MPDQDLLSIGAFSMMTKLTQRALRLYEEKGLLVPERKEITGYRWYSYAQVKGGIRLRILADMGFGIQDMREVSEALEQNDLERLRQLEQRRKDEIIRQMNELMEAKSRLDTYALMEMLEMREQDPVLKELPAIRVLSMRGTGSYGEVIPLLLGKIYRSLAGEAQVRVTGPAMVIYHDDEYKETDADVEVVLPISGRITAGAEMDVKNLEPCKVISMLHKGPYQMIGSTWGKVTHYAIGHGYRIMDRCREIYLNDPNQVSQADLLTEVQLRVE
jgi:effector-binding domain-containing protein